VLDFGTGTGVLAILAERLDAAAVTAIDHDDWSIENARENVRNNACERITVLKRDSSAGLEGLFDVILANINKHVIVSQLAVFGQQLAAGGVILLSGLLEDDFQDIEKETVATGFSVSGRTQKGTWICIRTEKKIK
jgi:ribosomal protein L11 methyltransferase